MYRSVRLGEISTSPASGSLASWWFSNFSSPFDSLLNTTGSSFSGDGVPLIPKRLEKVRFITLSRTDCGVLLGVSAVRATGVVTSVEGNTPSVRNVGFLNGVVTVDCSAAIGDLVLMARVFSSLNKVLAEVKLGCL